MKSAGHWIHTLGLQPHPEGGYFRETYRAAETIPAAGLPDRFDGARPFSTAIYFLLESGGFSALHRIKSDEAWHFHAGSPLEIIAIDPAGTLRILPLGEGAFQAVVPAGCWFGARVAVPSSYALVGCTVAPGFDFADFEMGRRADLLQHYPQHRELILQLTHGE